MRHFAETVRGIFFYLRQYKSRTFMTMFGITWGTMTVIVLLAFGGGVDRSMRKSMHGMGEGIAIMWPGRTSIPFEGYGRDRQLYFVYEDAKILRQEIKELDSISPEFSRWGMACRVDDRVNQPNISGVVTEYGPMRHIWPQPGGRWLNDLDLRDRRRVAFLGNDLKDFLFGKENDAVGKFFKIGDIPFLVVGVLRPKTQNSSYSSRDKDRVFIPATTFQSIFGGRYLNNMVYKVKDPKEAKLVGKKMDRIYGRKFHFDPNDDEALWIWDTTEMDKFVDGFSMGLRSFLGLIGAITLIVGGIGLANIMYVVVQERTREIGIQRAVGARRHTIMQQFMLECFIIIAISALIGFILAFLIIQLVALLPIEDYVGTPQLSWPIVLLSISILGTIGFLAGYFPSRRASRLIVVECLRS